MLKMTNPSHPGEFIKTEVIDSYNLSVTDAAEALGVTRQALSMLLNKHTSLSTEMAIRVEKAFGFDMATLMRMQTSYEITRARQQFKTVKVKPYNLEAQQTT